MKLEVLKGHSVADDQIKKRYGRGNPRSRTGSRMLENHGSQSWGGKELFSPGTPVQENGIKLHVPEENDV